MSRKYATETREARREENKRKWAEQRAARDAELEERRAAAMTIDFKPEGAQDYHALPPEKRKELMKEFLWAVAMSDEGVAPRDRLTAAAQLARLEGFEKQEVKIEIDAVTRFFDKEFAFIENEPPAWQAQRVIECEATAAPTAFPMPFVVDGEVVETE